MTTHQGGQISSSKKSKVLRTFLQKKEPIRSLKTEFAPKSSKHAHLFCSRKIREIVTVSGRGVRGHFPSFKGERLKYESLVEEAVLRVFEVAGCIEKIRTQPAVLELGLGGERLRYTPDVAISINDIEIFVETKPDNFNKNQKIAKRLKKIVARMRLENVPFFIIVESDVLANNLQEKLKDLLSKRSCPGRFDPDIDSSLWDPFQRNPENSTHAIQWKEAQKICDDLLQRVMRRDPDSLLQLI